MKWKELKGLSVQDLPAKMSELKLQLMKDNAQVAIGTVPKSPGRIRAFKRTIARIHTLLSQNALASKKSSDEKPTMAVSAKLVRSKPVSKESGSAKPGEEKKQ